MKSPFPGMDPYIEDRNLWEDFALSLICDIARYLGEVLPERYAPQIGVREYTAICYSEEDCIYPTPAHVRAACAPPSGPERPKGEHEPLPMRAFFDERHRDRFVHICGLSDESRPVTVIEVLSPSIKRRGSEGRELYLRQRNALLLGQANLVEIDLLRGGQRMPMVEPWPKSPYYLLVGRQSRVPYCRVWPAHFRQPLPVIPVPLDSPDPDLSLNLQPLIEDIFTRSRYARRIDYSRPLTPTLPADEAAWLSQQLRPQATAAKPKSSRPRRGRP